MNFKIYDSLFCFSKKKELQQLFFYLNHFNYLQKHKVKYQKKIVLNLTI